MGFAQSDRVIQTYPGFGVHLVRRYEVSFFKAPGTWRERDAVQLYQHKQGPEGMAATGGKSVSGVAPAIRELRQAKGKTSDKAHE